MSKYGYGSSPPKTKAGSYVENTMGKGMILMMAGAPIFILASGNPAGLLALPMLLTAPLAFTDTRRKSDQEFKAFDSEEDKRLMALSPEDLIKELSKIARREP